MDLLEKLLNALPFARLVKRYSSLAKWVAYVLLGILGLALLVNVKYHLLLIDHDDVYVTRPIQNTALMITVPRVTHGKSKEYQLFLSAAPVPSGPSVSTVGTLSTTMQPTGASPPATVPAVPSATTVVSASARAGASNAAIPTVVRILGAEGIVLLPQQTMTFTFTSDIYQSYALSYTNSFSEQLSIPRDLFTRDAAVAMAVDGQPAQKVHIDKEGMIWAFLRRTFVDNLGGVLFTSIIPITLICVAFIYEQIDKERLKDYSDRLDYIEKHLDDETSDEYLSTMKIINREYEDFPDELKNRFDDIRVKIFVNDITRFIVKGDIDKAKQEYISKPQDISKSLKREDIEMLEDLVSDSPDVHLERIKDHKGHINEHISWLIHEDDSKLSTDMLSGVLEMNRKGIFTLERSIYGKVERLFRVRSISLPPHQEKNYFVTAEKINSKFAYLFFNDRVKQQDQDKLYEVLDDFIGELKLDPDKQVITIAGPSGSGKTQLLKRFVQNETEGRVFYVWSVLTTTHVTINSAIRSIQESILQEFFVLLVDNPNLWHLVEGDIQKRLSNVIVRRPYLFDCDPVNYLKIKKMPSPFYEDSRFLLIGWLQQCFQRSRYNDERYGFSNAMSFIDDVGNTLGNFGFEKICFCLENANNKLNISSLLKTLNGYLKQRVFLRLVYERPPESTSGITSLVDVTWRPEWFEKEPLLGYLPRFDNTSVSNKFKEQITVLGDLEPWLDIFRDDTTVTEARWNEVYNAMAGAREKRVLEEGDPAARNWTMADSKRARGLLVK